MKLISDPTVAMHRGQRLDQTVDLTGSSPHKYSHFSAANSTQGAQVKEKGREGRTGPFGAAAFESTQVNCRESQ